MRGRGLRPHPMDSLADPLDVFENIYAGVHISTIALHADTRLGVFWSFAFKSYYNRHELCNFHSTHLSYTDVLLYGSPRRICLGMRVVRSKNTHLGNTFFSGIAARKTGHPGKFALGCKWCEPNCGHVLECHFSGHVLECHFFVSYCYIGAL